MISTLLPIASIALKLGSQLLSGSAKTQPAQQPAQEERLAPQSRACSSGWASMTPIASRTVPPSTTS